MLDLARKAAELLVERIHKLPGEGAWDGEFRDAIAKGIRLAARAQDYVEASPMLDVVSPASLGVVCFRVNPARISMDDEGLDEINRKVLARMFWDDPSFISSASPHGRFSLRLCIINHNTRWTDVKETLQAVERFGADTIKTAD